MGDAGRHIRRLRDAYGFDVQAVADLARLPVDRVAAIEAGDEPTIYEIGRVAAALVVDPASLLNGKTVDPKRSPARFRASTEVAPLDAHDVRTLAVAQEVGRLCAFLSSLLHREIGLLEYRDVRPLSGLRDPYQEGYEFGEDARNRIQGDRAPIPSVEALLQELGVHVAFVSFRQDQIEAVSLYEPDSSPVVLLNQNCERVQYPLARRAILAHELCHLLYDSGERDLVTVISRAGDHSGIEQRANAFAPAFIAPRPWLSARSKQPKRICKEIGESWGLSFEGSVWHAKNARLITHDQADALVRGPAGHLDVTEEFERRPDRTPPEFVGIEVEPTDLTCGLLQELVIIAKVEGAISAGRASEILRLA